MENEGSGQFKEHFGDLPDPRIGWTKRHKLIDIVVIAICAVICGADDWVEVARLARCLCRGRGSGLCEGAAYLPQNRGRQSRADRNPGVMGHFRA